LKEEGRPKLEIQAAVAELKVRKKALEQREAQLTSKTVKFDRSGLEDLLKRRFFYAPSFEIYGGA
jgi:glycyl-tRNA synthetase